MQPENEKAADGAGGYEESDNDVPSRVPLHPHTG
jgi:hypothetical protein